MQQKELISVLYDAEVLNDSKLNQEVTAIVNDNRRVDISNCFIAIRGENFDGHSVLDKVVEAGATLLIVERLPEEMQDLEASIVKVDSTFRAQAILANKFYNQPTEQMNVVAVTGTNGKTTTSSMISQLLEANGRQTGLIGTIQYKVGNKIYPAVNTTPNSLVLQELFNEMVEVGCKDAIIEASSHALALGRLWYTDIDCAIFTNLTREHLDFHKTMEGYANAKSLLFSQLGQSFHNGRPRLAILNLDDPYSEIMAQATAADIVTYSLKDKKATVYADAIKAEEGKTAFDMYYQGELHHVAIPMRGSYNVANFLAAFLCLSKYYQIPTDSILSSLEDFNGVSGRMQSIDRGQEFEIVVDFAHTPDALERVLSEIVDHKKKNQKLVALMGHSGGNRDSGARPLLGDLLFQYADEIVFTADNPRFEPVSKIVSEMIGDHQEKKYTIIEDRIEAINYMIDQAGNNDILLFAGKGGEAYQVIANENVPYDEVETVLEALNNRLERKQ